jgi:dethiobiotin synthetase
MRGCFVTGTDTGIGKTLFTVALARALVTRGLKVATMKPVAAGTVTTPHGDFNDDALELMAAANVDAPYEDVNPWCLRAAASPHLAARAEGVRITLDRIQVAAARLAAASDLVLAEGAGGWHAPISDSETMADVAAALALPIVIVVGLRLGCLNHALLTREAVRERGLVFAGWVANELDTRMPLADANIDTLSDRFRMPPLTIIPASSESAPKASPRWAAEAAKRLVSP